MGIQVPLKKTDYSAVHTLVAIDNPIVRRARAIPFLSDPNCLAQFL